MAITGGLNPRQVTLQYVGQLFETRLSIEKPSELEQHIRKFQVRYAARVCFRELEGSLKIPLGLLEGIDVEAFLGGHCKVTKGFSGRRRAPVMIREGLGHPDNP